MTAKKPAVMTHAATAALTFLFLSAGRNRKSPPATTTAVPKGRVSSNILPATGVDSTPMTPRLITHTRVKTAVSAKNATHAALNGKGIVSSSL